MTLKTDTGVHNIVFGDGRWQIGETDLPSPNLAPRNVKRLRPFKTAGSYHWTAPGILELKLRFIESPFTQTITCHFDQNRMDADFHNSYESPYTRTVVVGEYPAD